MCQPPPAITNRFANGKKRLIEQCFPSPLAWVFGSGIILPETNAPHWVQRLSSSNRLLPVLKR